MKNELRSPFAQRQYMLSGDFELYYYDDQTLTSVENHTHSYWEFYFFLEGSAEMYLKNQPVSLCHGDIIAVAPKVPHHAAIHSEKTSYRRFIFWVSCSFLEKLMESSPDFGYLTERASENGYLIFHVEDLIFNAVQAEIFEFLEEIHSRRFGREARLMLLAGQLLLEISRIYHEQKNQREDNGEPLYDNIAHFIEGHLDEPLSLDFLAQHFFVSKYYIAHLFKDNMGISVHQYIQKKRLLMSRNAILNGVGVNEACLMYGFNDYSVFYRAFVREYGISPKKYRERMLNASKEKEWV